MSNNFKNPTENLFRGVIPKYWMKGKGRTSSAVFKDSRGVSVNRACLRGDDECADQLHEQRYPDNWGAIISVTVDDCTTRQVCLQCDPIEKNNYHCILKRSEEIIVLTNRQAKELSNCSRLYWKYEEKE